MNAKQIMDAIRSLAASTGLYGRLLRDLEADPAYKDAFLEAAVAAGPKDVVDFVLWFES